MSTTNEEPLLQEDLLEWWARLEALHELRARLRAWEAAMGWDPLAADRAGTLSQYLEGLRALLLREPDRARAAMLAAFAFGPRDAGLPAPADLEGLLSLAAAGDADPVDMAVAWGCGWCRQVRPGPGWNGRWVAALIALASLVRSSIHRALDWLGDNVLDFREALDAAGQWDRSQRLEGYCHLVTMELATGGCRCGHGNKRCRSLADGCGRDHHRLQSWNPDVCRLRAFVATAVRGSAQPALRTGAFGVSMLSSLLREDHLLRVDLAEFRVCHICNADLIRGAVELRRKIDISELRRGLYDLSRCPTCEGSPDPERTYHTGRKNWLIVPAEWGGRHQAARRYRCLGCGNLFTVDRMRCPLCGWQVRDQGRFTSVWVRLLGLRHAA